MILGVSHIVLSSTDLTRDRKTLEYIGWKTIFEQRGIPTHPGKRPFMSTQSEEQGLVFMQPPQGTPVELIHYADELPDRSDSPMQILLPEPKIHANYDRLTYQLQFSPKAPIPSLITHFVTDIDVAGRFWQMGLGFQPAAAQDGPIGSLKLEFRSLISQWCATLLLIRREKVGIKNLIDGPGYRCLSLICNDMRSDSALLLKAGIKDTTGIMELEINGKKFELEIFSGPDGAMVEFIKLTSQPPRFK